MICCFSKCSNYCIFGMYYLDYINPSSIRQILNEFNLSFLYTLKLFYHFFKIIATSLNLLSSLQYTPIRWEFKISRYLFTSMSTFIVLFSPHELGIETLKLKIAPDLIHLGPSKLVNLSPVLLFIIRTFFTFFKISSWLILS